jgi:hypothetical protein
MHVGTEQAAGDVLDIMEMRHDWAAFHFTLDLFKYVLFTLIPDVVRHTEKQDEDQVRDHYERMCITDAMLNAFLIFTQVATTSTAGSWETVWSTRLVLSPTSTGRRPWKSSRTTS